jgi:DNA modification methylase
MTVDNHELGSIDDLKPASYNPRKISKKAFEGLEASLKKFGDISGIVWNKRTGNLVAGHQRVAKLRELGGQLVGGAVQIASGERFPVRVVDWSELQEMAANVEANNPTIGGVFDEKLNEILDLVWAGVGEIEFKDLGLDELLKNSDLHLAPKTDNVPVGDGPVCVAKDVWNMGDHVLYCGDFLKSEIKERCDLLVTDPPYGVDYAAKNKFLNKASNQSGRIVREISGEGLCEEDLTELWKRVFTKVGAILNSGAAFYVCSANNSNLLIRMISAIQEGMNTYSQILIWVKDCMVMGRSDYQYRHEIIFYGWCKGAAHHTVTNRQETTVWEFPRPLKNELHPTMKPVELYMRAITNSTDRGAYVLDPFAGSGTCVIACERTGRKAVVSEIDLDYCSIILKRWEDETGKKAVKHARN